MSTGRRQQRPTPWRAATWLAVGLMLAGCAGESSQPVPVRDEARRDGGPGVAVPTQGDGDAEALKYTANQRATRRAFDGAPPVIFHEPLGIECVECHSQEGKAVDDLGFAPPSPHEETAGLSLISRCEQCHVYALAEGAWRANEFAGIRQDLRRGGRLYDGAPPRIPHEVFMRENCQACHAGPAAREEIRCTHPERVRCRQCHVPVLSTAALVLEATP